MAAPRLGDPVFSGYYVSASWILSWEMRAYTRRSGTFGLVPVSQSVYQGGKGAWELVGRFSNVDLTDGLVEGGEMEILSLGLNWFAAPRFHVNLNYRHIALDRLGIQGHSDGLNARIVLLLE